MIYTHVLNRGGTACTTPLDLLWKAVVKRGGRIMHPDRSTPTVWRQLEEWHVVAAQVLVGEARSRQFRLSRSGPVLSRSAQTIVGPTEATTMHRECAKRMLP